MDFAVPPMCCLPLNSPLFHIPHPLPLSYSPDCARMMPDGSKICQWRCQPGYVVVNCDGSFRSRDERVGCGFIVRNYRGEVIMAKANCWKLSSRKGLYWLVVLTMEMIAILDGLEGLSKHQKDFPRIEVQSDSKDAIEILNNPAHECPQECEDVLKKILVLVGRFQDCRFKFVYREANRAADFMSKCLKEDGVKYLNLSKSLPDDLENILREDATSTIYLRRPRKF